MNTKQFDTYYFIGIGGIGMSALARFFNALGKKVAGYDRTRTPLTEKLIKEGIAVHFEDDINLIDDAFLNPETNLVIYTPAVPKDHSELGYFQQNGFHVMKRAQILGVLTKDSKGLAVAGSHGKTTVSTMIGHLLYQSKVKASAVLGGIATNYESNILLPEPDNEYTVVEADEFDRSLLQLNPYMAVVTAVDADHLDIYGTKEELKKTFAQFISQIVDGGVLLHKQGIDILIPKGTKNRIRVFQYAIDGTADFHAENIRLEGAFYRFDLVTPEKTIENIKLGVPGKVNLENSIAAAAIAHLAGATDDELRTHLKGFKGIKRRFEYIIEAPGLVYIDDYAHHPQELEAIISSVKQIYPDRKVTGVFQPHLYSRTQDFAGGFAESLSALDEVVLLDIYPAREEPIPGVTSSLIFDRIDNTNKLLITKEALLDTIQNKEIEVLLTLGAGNIDQFVRPLKELLNPKALI